MSSAKVGIPNILVANRTMAHSRRFLYGQYPYLIRRVFGQSPLGLKVGIHPMSNMAVSSP